MTPELLATLQSGVMYIHGRDINYRPIVVMDLERVIALGVSDPEVVGMERMTRTFVYLWNYMKKAMFLPG